MLGAETRITVPKQAVSFAPLWWTGGGKIFKCANVLACLPLFTKMPALFTEGKWRTEMKLLGLTNDSLSLSLSLPHVLK